jgi:5-formyltetrahydrofolate cyclo-ligase
MDRATLRNQLRSRRKALSEEQQALASKHLASVVCNLDAFYQSQHIALYLASDGEASPEQVVETVWNQGKLCYLPVLDPVDRHAMHFQRYDQDTELVVNRFGIAEPSFDQAACLAAKSLDLVLMPLTGFDEQGNRLGMGGGFYDRTFAFVEQGKKPVLIGLAHECQKVEKIPVADWDVPMKGVATDKAFYG